VTVDDPRQRRAVLVGVCIALMAVIASVSGLNVAQPEIALEFDASQSTVMATYGLTVPPRRPQAEPGTELAPGVHTRQLADHLDRHSAGSHTSAGAVTTPHSTTDISPAIGESPPAVHTSTDQIDRSADEFGTLQ
jgi:hypothetical protein